MLLIKTQIKESPIHGIGLFAAEAIPAGTVIWKFVPHFDQKIPQRIAATLPAAAQEHLEFYGYISKKSDCVVLPTDHGKFVNHAVEPTCDSVYLEHEDEVVTVALKDIAAGEEITEDYARFERLP